MNDGNDNKLANLPKSTPNAKSLKIKAAFIQCKNYYDYYELLFKYNFHNFLQ